MRISDWSSDVCSSDLFSLLLPLLLLAAELVGVAHAAAHDPAQHVAAALVGRQHAVGDQEGAGTQVVGDDPVRDRMLAVGRLIGGFGRGFDDGAPQVGVVVFVLPLTPGCWGPGAPAGVERGTQAV